MYFVSFFSVFVFWVLGSNEKVKLQLSEAFW